MKKIIIYGVKVKPEQLTKDDQVKEEYEEEFLNAPSEIVATIWVDENKKVVVEAINEDVKKDLMDMIYLGNDPETYTPRAMMHVPPTPEEEAEDRKRGAEVLRGAIFEAGDKDFLDALEFDRIGGKAGEYIVYGVVEEE